MYKTLTTTLLFLLLCINDTTAQQRDLMADTWVATDGVGRTMPTSDDVGTIKTDKQRTVGIFYITWHDENIYNSPTPYRNVTETIAQNTEARFTDKTGLWSHASNMGSYHWGEPEAGYFLSCDRYVIRHDLSMLVDAGVDVLILDVTNAVCYYEQWDTLFDVMRQMKEEGSIVPKICFWTYNGAVITTTQNVYERYYKQGKYSDLWFYWDGKPLLLCNMMPALDANGGGVLNPNPNYDEQAVNDTSHVNHGNPDYCERYYKDYTREVKDFFTMRNMWWGYYTWGGKRYVGTEDNWSFGYEMNDKNVAKLSPEKRVATHQGRKEEMAVTPAQHPISMTGKSWRVETGEPAANEYDLPVPTYVPWLGKTVENPEAYGIYFQDRWDEALSVDPDFVYLNDWNEWTAGKYTIGKAPGSDNPGPTSFLGRENNTFYFVDQYNSEYNRTIQPAKGVYTDNYYMQMVQNIRRYKGVRPTPQHYGTKKVKIDGLFDDWKDVVSYYFDTRNDTYHRDHNGYAGTHYTDTTGRNDIIECKVAVGNKSVSFYVKTDSAISSYTDRNWMLLLIDADNDHNTGWNGYDYIVNKDVKDSETSTLMRYDGALGQWMEVCSVAYRAVGNELELSIPRLAMGLTDNEMVFDFKWTDNPQDLNDIISICTTGDTAPNRRFNYRFKWSKQQEETVSSSKEKPTAWHVTTAVDYDKLPRTINSGKQGKLHVQGIAVDLERGFVYYSFTTRLVKTDLTGRILGSVEGLTGHLGCIAIDRRDGRVYGSLEYKNDFIGKGIRAEMNKKDSKEQQEGFYVAIFDTERICQMNLNAEKDGIMRTVFLPEVLDDYTASVENNGRTVKHRYGCSGIDGIAFAPSMKDNKDTRLYVAYGLYSDTTRTDNDYQVLLEYDIKGWDNVSEQLKEDNPHTTGRVSPVQRYFVHTGNTLYGIQNLTYDETNNRLLAAVNKGKKSTYPNYLLFAIDFSKKPKKQSLPGYEPQTKVQVLSLAETGIKDEKTGVRGWNYEMGSTGLSFIGDGYFYISEKIVDKDGTQSSLLHLCRWNGSNDKPFVMCR